MNAGVHLPATVSPAVAQLASVATLTGLFFAIFGVLASLQLAITAGVAAGAWRALADRPDAAADAFG
jgi:hypothetical protein